MMRRDLETSVCGRTGTCWFRLRTPLFFGIHQARCQQHRTAVRGSPNMASVVTVLACVAIPVVCACQNKNRVTGPGRPDTAQDVHVRRRVQHFCSGMALTLGYKWAITDARTGEEGSIVAQEDVFCFVCAVAVGDCQIQQGTMYPRGRRQRQHCDFEI